MMETVVSSVSLDTTHSNPWRDTLDTHAGVSKAAADFLEKPPPRGNPQLAVCVSSSGPPGADHEILALLSLSGWLNIGGSTKRISVRISFGDALGFFHHPTI
jgi:hypothetical protein